MRDKLLTSTNGNRASILEDIDLPFATADPIWQSAPSRSVGDLQTNPLPTLDLRLRVTADKTGSAALAVWFREIVRDELQGLLGRHAAAYGAAKNETDLDGGYISVGELAEQIGESDGITRTLLQQGLIPGARRKNPSKQNSHWLVPANAAGLYKAGFYRGHGGAR